MSQRLEKQLKKIIASVPARPDIVKAYRHRLKEGLFSRDDNKQSHFCVYFAAYDPKAEKVYLGHHKKSGFWLFTGGHIDRGETPTETVIREIWEEWGQRISSGAVGKPVLLTITEIIDNPRVLCKRHFDIWYLFGVELKKFKVDFDKLAKEFYQNRWVSLAAAQKLVVDDSTRQMLNYLNFRIVHPRREESRFRKPLN